ncbi:MAG: hypothetical protein ACK4UU_02995 [Fimbriimonadales bacterium]
MPTITQSRLRTQPKKRTAHAASRPASPTRAPRTRQRTPTRRAILLPLLIIAGVVATHLGVLAMLNYETARREQLSREIDRVKLNIERLRGQIAVYTNEVALSRWAEQAGMVRVELQPELTIIGLDAPITPSIPLAMRPTE